MDIRYVHDTNGVQYHLARPLGRGGQGAVYQVSQGRLAVKLLFERSARRREHLKNQLAHVRLLPLDGLPIARPTVSLREPNVGYVMELLTGMEPLQRLIWPGRGNVVDAAWYNAGGGLRRRLILLAKTADALAQLHARGLIFTDISPSNVFVSKNADQTEVCLIDADNLVYHSSQGANPIYTPRYGAPEVVAGTSGPTSLSDAFAFAVTAFQVLTLAHPLLGDAVMGGEFEQEEKALAGAFPWVDHPIDRSNASSSGFPRSIVLSPGLCKVFEEMFNEGLLQREARPGMGALAESLHLAAEPTVTCPACRGTYYLKAGQCPWDGAPPPPMIVGYFELWEPERRDIDEAGQIDKKVKDPHDISKNLILLCSVVTELQSLIITRWHKDGCTQREAQTPQIELKLDGKRLLIRSLDGATYALAMPGGDVAVVDDKPRDLQPAAGKSYHLHLGPPDKLHRVLRLISRGGRS